MKDKKKKIKSIFPIRKDNGKLYCPDCDVELITVGWEDHTSPRFVAWGGGRVGSEGWTLRCPKCKEKYYEAVQFYD